jgi:TonB family protein
VQSTILNTAPIEPSGVHLTTAILNTVLIAYFAALLYFAGRLLLRIHRTRTLSRDAQPITLTGEVLSIWNRCAQLFNVYDAQLATSPHISGPSTVGFRRRMVLLPPTLLSAHSHDDLAAALAHEFAHMRRHDFAMNVLYEAFAVPMAWHPAVHLTRLRLVESREMVCDELAADATSGSIGYAQSLLRLAAASARSTRPTAFHAIGILDANALERRVMTLANKRSISPAVRRTSALVAVLLGIAVCASAMSFHVEVPAPAIATTSGQETPHGPVRIAGGVAQGQLLSHENPVYPASARANGIEGTVVLRAVIGEDGTIKDLAVLSGPPELQSSAIDAVKRWTYRPYLLNGEPVEVQTTITVHYALAPQHHPTSDSSQPAANEEAAQTGGSDPGIYDVGGSVRPPIVIHQADPKYAEAARNAKLSGNVVISLVVGTDGKPYNVQVARGLGHGLDEQAVEAVQQYRFKPATRNGEPVAAYLNVEVNFQIF